MKRRHRDLETPIQADIVSTLRLTFPDVIVASIPNGGFVVEPRIVAKLKWAGLLPGMPDLIAIWEKGFGFGEVKSPQGVLSPAQKLLFPVLKSKGVRVDIWRSPADAIASLTAWGAPSRIVK